MGVVERRDAIVDESGGGNRRLAVVELSEGDLGIGVDERLLVDVSNRFESCPYFRVEG
jgi:hypothetical protein